MRPLSVKENWDVEIVVKKNVNQKPKQKHQIFIIVHKGVFMEPLRKPLFHWNFVNYFDTIWILNTTISNQKIFVPFQMTAK